MTVLPTVRGQIEQAAHRQANAGPAPTRRRGRLSGGGGVVGLAVAVAVCVAVAAVALLGRGRTVTVPPGSGPAHRYPLTGDGIGTVTFGETPERVVAGLRPLLGPPVGAGTSQRPHGLVPSICGFDYEIDWMGFPERSTGSRHVHSVGLTVYFRHSRFAGYAYGPPFGDRNTPLVRHGVMLATAAGLGLDQPVARARRLYGPAFVVARQEQGTPPNPRLERLPAWHVRTAAGLIYGYLDSRQGGTIGTISAGSVPNTPCRSHPQHAHR